MFSLRLHPLIGARPGALARTLWRHGGVSLGRVHLVILTILLGLVRWPNCCIESIRTRSALSIALDQSPVFIVGHWRSGTTLLHHVLSRDQSFCFPRMIDVLSPFEFFPSAMERFTHPLIYRMLALTRPMDEVPLHPSLPQEEEIALAAMAASSFYNCIYFPERFENTFRTEVLLQSEQGTQFIDEWSSAYRYYLGKLVLRYPGRRLLLKNPANSARIRTLTRLFPGAKFIHIHRNPYDVFSSMSKFYQRMLPILALQAYDTAKIDDYVLRAYLPLMTTLLKDTADLKANEL